MGGLPPISDAEWSRVQKALADNAGNISHAAKALGIPRQTLQSRIKARSDFPDGLAIRGTSTLYGPNGDVRLTWVKTREEPLSIDEIASQVREALDEYEPPQVFPVAPTQVDSDLATLYPLVDWHVGLRSWKKETGHNYDLKIAQTTIKTAMTRLLSVAPNSSQAVILGLGDLMHSDNYDNMTSRSKNILDVDGRYPRVLSTATQLVIFTVDLALQKHETVLLRILPGNHDDQSAIAVTLALSLYYQNNLRVTVDDDAGRFWWWVWGKVFLGATHGDKAKMKDLPIIMAARNPEAWGKTKFRHTFTGHIHRDSCIEIGGVTVESLRTPVAPDSYSIGMGFDSGRAVQAITYHKDQGEIMRQKVNIV